MILFYCSQSIYPYVKLVYFFKKFFLTFIYFFETERDRAWMGEGQRERGRHRIQNRLQALSCRHRARSRAQTHRPRDHDLSRSWTLNWLSHPDAPKISVFCSFVFLCLPPPQNVSPISAGGLIHRIPCRIASTYYIICCIVIPQILADDAFQWELNFKELN